jgi:hypothetical protein
MQSFQIDCPTAKPWAGMDISRKVITVILIREKRLIIGSEEKLLQMIGFSVHHAHNTIIGADNEKIYLMTKPTA